MKIFFMSNKNNEARHSFVKLALLPLKKIGNMAQLISHLLLIYCPSSEFIALTYSLEMTIKSGGADLMLR
jgi:hypothetical protein